MNKSTNQKGGIKLFCLVVVFIYGVNTFSRMGNVAITSVSMMGNVNGWFIPVSVHPVCFGIGSIMKKPVVTDDKIEIREMLNMTILLDHDVFDGANMARFINDLSKNIKNGIGL